jgi:uncharacterized protein (TIGR02001 family)
MKRFILPFAFAALGASPAVAQSSAAAPAAPAWSFSVTPEVVSQYMFRGVRVDGMCLQPTVEGDYGNLAIGVWASTPLRDKVPGVSDPEIDPYLTYTLNLSDAVSLQPTLYVYSYPRADVGDGSYRSTFEPNVALNYTWHGVKLTPKIYYDLVLRGPTYEFNAAAPAVPLPRLGTELDFAGSVGTYDQGDVVNGASPKVKNWGNYWLFGVTLPFTLSPSAKLSVGYAYTEGTDNYTKQGSAPKEINATAVGRGVATVSCSWTF